MCDEEVVGCEGDLGVCKVGVAEDALVDEDLWAVNMTVRMKAGMDYIRSRLSRKH